MMIENERLFLAWAYASLEEINPSNYDHDDVCSMNAASVEVMLAIKARLDALKALENGPAVLADATNDPASSDLSSLRKGAEDMRTALKDCAQWLDVILAEKVIVEPENEQHIAASIARARAALVSGSREDGDG